MFPLKSTLSKEEPSPATQSVYEAIRKIKANTEAVDLSTTLQKAIRKDGSIDKSKLGEVVEGLKGKIPTYPPMNKTE